MYRSHEYPDLMSEAHAPARCSAEPRSRSDASDIAGHPETLPTSHPGWSEASVEAHEIALGEWHGDGQLDELARRDENQLASEAFSPMSSAEDRTNSPFLVRHFEETTAHLAIPKLGRGKVAVQKTDKAPKKDNNWWEAAALFQFMQRAVNQRALRAGRNQITVKRLAQLVVKRYQIEDVETAQSVLLVHARNLCYMIDYPRRKSMRYFADEPIYQELMAGHSLSAAEQRRAEGVELKPRRDRAILKDEETQSSDTSSEEEDVTTTLVRRPPGVGISTACNSDMDLETETRLVVKEEHEDIGSLFGSVERLDIQDLDDNDNYQSHSGGAQDGHHTTTNQNYDIGRQRGNDATAPQSSAPLKRPLTRKFGEDEDEEDKKGKKRRVKHVPIAGEVMEGLLACPFPKHDPFSYSNCWTYATDNIPHLKQHLKRDHLTPVHCPNCGQIFTGLNSNSEKDRHFIQQTCVQDVTVATRRQGITADQQKQIWRNKPRSMDDNQYWNYIYEVLFASEPPLHPRPEDYVNLGLQLLRQKVTKNFSGLLENRPERADFRLDDLHERTRQDSRSNTPSLPDLLDQAFDIAIVQRHTVTPLLSTFKGCSSGASTHASDSGYASLDTNSAEEDSAPATGHTPQSRASDEAFYPTEDLSCHPEQYREFLEKANHAEGESSTTQVIDYDQYLNPANISKDSDEPVDGMSDSFSIDFEKKFQNDLDAGWEFGL